MILVNTIKQKLRTVNGLDITALFICLLFTIGAVLLNLNRYWQYESGQYDFGIFDSAIWSVSRFQTPIIEHLVLSGKHIWADHFHPSIFLLSPIYWFTDRSEAILIAQDIFVGLSGLALYSIGIKLLKNRFISVCVLIAYFLFTGLQNAVLFDFHEVTVATFFIMMVYWSIFYERRKLFTIFFLLVLGFKESMFLFGFGTSFFIYFYKKEWKNVALISGFFSLIYGFVVIKYIIPFFSGGIFLYALDQKTTAIELITRLFSPFIKVKTIFLSLLSFLFLPIFTPLLFITMILHYAARFTNPFGERWDLGLHYNAEIAPTLAVATILGLVFFSKKLSRTKVNMFGIALLFVSLILYRFILHGPFGLVYNKAFYEHTKNFKFLDDLIAQVPKDQNVSVTAQNNLLGRFSHHKKIKLLRTDYYKYKTDYILFDLRAGQNPNNFFMNEKDVVKTFEAVKEDEDYEMIYKSGDQYAFKLVK